VTAPIAVLGRGVARRVASTGGLARFLVRTLTAWGTLPAGGRRVVRRIMLNQVWFTALQAIPIVIVLASILSYLVISQAVRELGRLNATELIGSLMVIAIVRELGPLLTAITVAGRSGTAIAAELVTTVRTVEAHVTHILDKLGFSSRTQVAVWAVVKGLARPSPAWEEEVQG